ALFETQTPLAICDRVHGDLNPRNMLMDAAENVSVIDFSTFGEGPLCKDFARIEIETIGKLLEPPGPVEQHGAFLASLLDGDLVASAERMTRLPLKAPYDVTAQVVAAVRTTLAGYHRTLGSGYDGQRAYLVALAGTCVRMALFSQYLSPVQQAAALLYTGLCLTQLTEDRSAGGR
ncbi:MAG TPA: phosphotransferase, partial [Planctomycetota bacterium]|nr:phosphotransferase [Planctomycetota bacterium]